jgi:hypothetical protein
MSPRRIQDIFESSFAIVEDNKESLPPKTLARIRGEMFVPNGRSRNKRFYSKDFWETVLGQEDLRQRMTEGLFLGTIGHDEANLDKLCQQGLVSHRVEKLWIDDQGRGMGEGYILDTVPAGRALHTLLSSGTKLRVSSKGMGNIADESNDDGDELPMADGFVLERFDYVTAPGFWQAQPGIAENISSDFHAIAEALLDNKSEDMINVNSSPDGAGGSDMNEVVERLTKQNVDLQGRVDNYLAEISEAKVLVAQYQALGSPAKLNETLTKANTALEQYQALGAPGKLRKTLTRANAALGQYQALGRPSQIAERLRVLSTIAGRFGLKAKSEAKTIAAAVETFIGKLAKIGPLDKIEKTLLRAQKTVESMVAGRHKIETEKLVKEFNVAEAQASELIKAHGWDKAQKLLAKLSESVGIDRRFSVAPVNGKTAGWDKDDRWNRIASQFSGVVPVADDKA